MRCVQGAPTENCQKNGCRIELQPWYTQSAGCSAQHHTLPHVFGRIPGTGTYNHFIYPYFFFYNFTMSFATKSNYTNVFPTIAQRSSNSDSLTCTSTAAFIGDPAHAGSDISGSGHPPPLP